MKLSNKFCLYLLCIFLIEVVTPVFADYSTLSVTPSAELESLCNAGYFYRSYRVENLTSEQRTVTVKLNYAFGENKLYTIKKIELAPNQSKEDCIFAPNSYGYQSGYGSVEFYDDEHVVFRDNIVTGSRTSRRVSKSVLVDKKISNLDAEKILSAKKNHHYGTTELVPFYYENNVELMPTNWVAYSQYSLLMYKESTFEEMPEAVRNAIMEYVRAGGRLVVIGSMDIPSDARKSSSSTSLGIDYECSLGFGGLMFLRSSIFEDVSSPGESTYKFSKNKRIRYSVKKSDEEQAKDDNNGEPGHYLIKGIRSDKIYEKLCKFIDDGKYRFSSDDFMRFDVKNEYERKYERNSSKSYLGLLVLVFAIVMGPLNYYILNKKDKKILVFVTTPIIAVICCLLVLGHDLIFEAGRFDIYRQSVTLLYQNENTAITSGNELFISGKSRNNCLEFPMSSVVTPYGEGREYQIGSIREREIRLENVQKYTENWITPKCPVLLAATSIKQSRARLEIKNTGDSIEVLNGLGADATNVTIISDDGMKKYFFSEIKSGAIARPERVENNFAKNQLLNFCAEYEYTNQFGEKSIGPGEYIAFLKTDPFLAQEIDSKATMHELGCIVIGRYKGNSK